MYILKTKRIIVLSIFFIGLTTYLSFKYFEYKQLNSFITLYESGSEQDLIIHSIDFYYLRFGVFPFTNDSSFKEFISELRIKYNNSNRFEFEKYPYEIDLDTIKGNYVLYSLGPDKVSNQLKSLPFNNIGNHYKFLPNQISFIDYLKMDLDFDIILNKHELEYDCSKHFSEISSFITSENVDDNSEYYYEKFKNEVINLRQQKEISSILVKKKDSLENVIITYNHKNIKFLCKGGLENNEIEQAKLFLLDYLREKFIDFEIVTFSL